MVSPKPNHRLIYNLPTHWDQGHCFSSAYQIFKIHIPTLIDSLLKLFTAQEMINWTTMYIKDSPAKCFIVLTKCEKELPGLLNGFCWMEVFSIHRAVFSNTVHYYRRSNKKINKEKRLYSKSGHSLLNYILIPNDTEGSAICFKREMCHQKI